LIIHVAKKAQRNENFIATHFNFPRLGKVFACRESTSDDVQSITLNKYNVNLGGNGVEMKACTFQANGSLPRLALEITAVLAQCKAHVRGLGCVILSLAHSGNCKGKWNLNKRPTREFKNISKQSSMG
jgi:hypothetical protein